MGRVEEKRTGLVEFEGPLQLSTRLRSLTDCQCGTQLRAGVFGSPRTDVLLKSWG